MGKWPLEQYLTLSKLTWNIILQYIKFIDNLFNNKNNVMLIIKYMYIERIK